MMVRRRQQQLQQQPQQQQQQQPLHRAINTTTTTTMLNPQEAKPPKHAMIPTDGTKVVAPPMVYIAGEEMTHYACELFTREWFAPYFDLSAWDRYDLSCRSRDETDDRVLHDAVAAGRRVGAIFKEPTITPSTEQVKEFGLKKALGSPNVSRFPSSTTTQNQRRRVSWDTILFLCFTLSKLIILRQRILQFSSFLPSYIIEFTGCDASRMEWDHHKSRYDPHRGHRTGVQEARVLRAARGGRRVRCRVEPGRRGHALDDLPPQGRYRTVRGR